MTTAAEIARRSPIFTDPPVVIGHRGRGAGSAGGFVENTVRSVQEAVRLGARWVEIDVRRTGDDTLVLGHNPRGRSGKFVTDLDEAGATEDGLQALAAIVDALPRDIGLDLDVKTSLEDALRPPERTTAGLLAPLLAAEARRRQVLVTSFDVAALLHARSVSARLAVGLLTWNTFPLRKAIAMAAQLRFDAVIAHTGSFLPDDPYWAAQQHDPAYAIDIAHRAGLEVGVWCPSPEAAVALAAAGADAFVVDDIASISGALRSAGRAV